MRRREFLKGTFGAAAVAAVLGADAACSRPQQAARNAIETENANPGTDAWRLNKLAQRREIEGYASLASVVPGGTIDLMVSTSLPLPFTIQIFRMGWYGGAGGRLMTTSDAPGGTIGPLDGVPRAMPAPTGAPDYLIDARWPVSYTLAVPNTWSSGYYLAKLTRQDGFERYVIFVVRDPHSKAPLVMQASVTTWQAYNYWGGKSLYSTFDVNAETPGFAPKTSDARSGIVSFDRPYETTHERDGAGEFFVWEANMVRWLERQGHDVTYVTNLDVHADGDLLRNRAAFLSVGHDEYWSNEMRRNVTLARDNGVNLGFFSSNVSYWRVRLSPNDAGVPDRRVVCYKDAGIDPTTTRWRDQSRPENLLVGVMYSGVWAGDYVVLDPTSWVFDGTGFKAGDRVRNLVGYEYDRTFANGYTPPGLSVLSRSVVGDDIVESSVYTAPSGAVVFATGTNHWSWALDEYRHAWITGEFKSVAPHAGIARATQNVFSRFLTTPNTLARR